MSESRLQMETDSVLSARLLEVNDDLRQMTAQRDMLRRSNRTLGRTIVPLSFFCGMLVAIAFEFFAR